MKFYLKAIFFTALELALSHSQTFSALVLWNPNKVIYNKFKKRLFFICLKENVASVIDISCVKVLAGESQ